MSENLLNAIEHIRANRDIDTYDEAMTKQAVVLRILAALGWDHFHPDEVRSEYATFGKRVDYSLRVNGINKVFIEVKQTCVVLDLHEEQLLRYAFQEGVKLAVLTNGVTWQFYLPLEEGAWTERRYDIGDLKQQTPAEFAHKLTEYLSHANVENGQAVKSAEQMLLSNRKRQVSGAAIPAVWNEIVSKPSDALVELIGDAVEQTCGFAAEGAAIRMFLFSHISQFSVGAAPAFESVLPIPSVRSYMPSSQQNPSANTRTDFKDECLARVEAAQKLTLTKRIGSRSYTADGETATYCTCSREYKGRAYQYWFTLYRTEMLKFESVVKPYLVLGCGSVQNTFAIPVKDLRPWLPRLRREKTSEQEGWDICIVTANGKWLLLTASGEQSIDITRYLL